MPQVTDPTQSFAAVYDAWNRMVKISSGASTVGTYTYDGRNRRIVKTTATETRHYYFTNGWQDIEERVGTSTSMDKQYVWGIRYIDELVARDDSTSQRHYACQDANFSLTSIADTSGGVQERYFFDPYGSREIMTALWGVLSSSAYDWVIGFQSLVRGAESGLLDGRNRISHPLLGAFASRDPARYLDGPNLYAYERANPIRLLDPTGLVCDPCQCFAQPGQPNFECTGTSFPRVWPTFAFGACEGVPGCAGFCAWLTWWICLWTPGDLFHPPGWSWEDAGTRVIDTCAPPSPPGAIA